MSSLRRNRNLIALSSSIDLASLDARHQTFLNIVKRFGHCQKTDTKIDMIRNYVAISGGRFLKQDKSGMFSELSIAEIKNGIEHCIAFEGYNFPSMDELGIIPGPNDVLTAGKAGDLLYAEYGKVSH